MSALGLPAGLAATLDPPLLRWILFLIALVWAVLASRDSGRGPSLLAGVAFSLVATGAWILALERPYGLLADETASRRIAEIAVAAATGRASAVAGAPAQMGLLGPLARTGLFPASVVTLVPSLLPAIVPILVAAAIAVFWGRRRDAPLAATLWLGFGTGGLDGLSERGFVPGLWRHPEAGLLIVPVVAAVLTLSRRSRPAWRGLAILAPCLLLLAPPEERHAGLGALLFGDLLDQGFFLWLGVFGLWRQRDVAALFLVSGGGLLWALRLTPLAPDSWATHVVVRLGLVLAATAPIRSWLEVIGRAVVAKPFFAGCRPAAAGLAVSLAIALPGSFLAWWQPALLDPVFAKSLKPLPKDVLLAAEWIRRETRADAVFAARPERGAWVAALGGRQVVWQPSLGSTPDDGRRHIAHRQALAGVDPGPSGARYGLSHVLLGPGDLPDVGRGEPLPAHLRLEWSSGGHRICSIRPRPAQTLQ